MIYPKQPRAEPSTHRVLSRESLNFMSESDFQEFKKEVEQQFIDRAWREELIPEGFWDDGSDKNYPKAEHSNFAHPKKAEILAAYDKLLAEDRFHPELNQSWDTNKNVICYRGFSNCRCCGILNGTRQYVSDGWEWPQGYRHYIDIHNVVPSDEFLKEVLGIEL